MRDSKERLFFIVSFLIGINIIRSTTKTLLLWHSIGVSTKYLKVVLLHWPFQFLRALETFAFHLNAPDCSYLFIRTLRKSSIATFAYKFSSLISASYFLNYPLFPNMIKNFLSKINDWVSKITNLDRKFLYLQNAYCLYSNQTTHHTYYKI